MKQIVQTAALALFIAAKAAAAQPITVAVFPFESDAESGRELGSQIALLVAAELSANPNIYTVERAELDKALGEQELGLSGTVLPDTAAKVGQLTGAKILVTGRVFKVGKETVAVAKIMSVETSRVFAHSARAGGDEAAASLSGELAKKVAATVSEQREALLAQGFSSEQKLAAFLEQYHPIKKLRIAVRIPERHYGAPAIDPAAQAELQVVFQKAGFEIVDDQSSAKADVEVTGEAFSAFGMRRGNLAACKARLEFTARDRVTGNVLHIDRETSVAVDIAEQTAAKTALENAAREVAMRFLQRLNQ